MLLLIHFIKKRYGKHWINRASRNLRKKRIPKSSLEEETQNLDYATAKWTHDHLTQFLKSTKNFVDLSVPEYDIPILETDQKTGTLQTYMSKLPLEECIQYATAYLDKYFKLEQSLYKIPFSKYKQASDDAIKYLQTGMWIYSSILPSLWW